MQSGRLSARLGHLLVALLAVFAFGAITAAAAQAEPEAPYWKVNGARLGKNETREITIKAYNGATEPIKL